MVEPTIVNNNQSLIEANAGSEIVLHCNVTYDEKLVPFGIDIAWYKSDDPSILSYEKNLTIPYLVDGEHSGMKLHTLTAIFRIICPHNLTLKSVLYLDYIKDSDFIFQVHIGVKSKHL